MSCENAICTLTDLVKRISKDTDGWTRNGSAKPWFRGQSNYEYPLLPSILRSGNEDKEVEITQKFRRMAPGYIEVPENSRLDQWLFLMQHHGIPTRLLDWTENPFYAALFATLKAIKADNEINQDATLFCIDPIEMNKISEFDYFPITWIQSSVLQTFKFAFGTEKKPVDGMIIPYLEKPIAIFPSTIHSRIRSQRGCFTLHGDDKRDIESIFQNDLVKSEKLIRYKIAKEDIPKILGELFDMGITYSSLFQDLDGLSCDLKYQFGMKSC